MSRKGCPTGLTLPPERLGLHCAIGLTLSPKGATTFSSTVRLVRALGEELFILSSHTNALTVSTLLQQDWPVSRTQTTPESPYGITLFLSCLHLPVHLLKAARVVLLLFSSCDNFSLNEPALDFDHLDLEFGSPRPCSSDL